MKFELFHVDAFASGPFRGNPAAVVPLSEWLPNDLMQSIALENNLSETAFFIPTGSPGQYAIRWFTPTQEVDLCGHATLASGHVLMGTLQPQLAEVRFASREAGELRVFRDGPRWSLDFPARPPERVTDATLKRQVEDAIAAPVKELWRSRALMAVLENEITVRALRPNIDKVSAIDAFALIVTAPGTDCDFVSRFFTPRAGIDEDPVTGSAHCTLVPYWANILNRQQLFARQVSKRGGELWCSLQNPNRVFIAGHAFTYLRGSAEFTL